MRPENREAFEARLRLAFLKDVSRTRLVEVLEREGAPERLLSAAAGRALRRSGDAQASLFPTDLTARLEEQFCRCVQAECEITAWTDPEYPALLKHIKYPPTVVFSRGNVSALSGPAVAVVGARRCSPSGRHVAEKLSRGLALAGFTIVSGLARGIDSAAHRGALSVGGTTVAVLGCGVDVCYPGENKKLLAEILTKGAVVSEFLLGTPPLRQNFPLRNRIISGLSLGVVVVEAGEKSGALVTTTHALEQGREVFVVPGDTTLTSTIGSNKLLKEGAKPVTCTEDIIEELTPRVARNLEPICEMSESPGVPTRTLDLSEDEESVLDCLSHTPVHVDEVCEQTGVDAPVVLTVLLSLELKGLVRQEPGNRFVRLIEM